MIILFYLVSRMYCRAVELRSAFKDLDTKSSSLRKFYGEVSENSSEEGGGGGGGSDCPSQQFFENISKFIVALKKANVENAKHTKDKVSFS